MADYVKVPDEKKPKRKLSWGKILLIALGVFLFFSIVSSISYNITPKVGVVPISGILMTETQVSLLTGTTQSSRDISEKLYELKEDNSVKAVVLDINSPGGSPVASEEISNAIKSVSEEKPVYALINDVGASGGFWLAVSADKVYASPMSMVGSIGATSAGLSFEDLIQEYNITYRDLTSVPYKDLGSPFREMKEDEREIIEEMLFDMQERFEEHVATSRNITREELEPYAQGQVYLGSKALEANLIDELGYYPDVLDDLQEEQDLLVVRHEASRPFFSLGGLSASLQNTPMGYTPLWFVS